MTIALLADEDWRAASSLLTSTYPAPPTRATTVGRNTSGIPVSPRRQPDTQRWTVLDHSPDS